MSDELDLPSRVCLVSAAAVQAGAKASSAEIEQQMYRLLRLSSGRAMARVERVLGEATFPAVILSAELEETSQRGLIKIRTEVSKRYPDGIEPIRTDPMWAGGRHLFDQAKALRSHKVLVHKAMEAKSDGTDEKVRILIGLTDLGMADGDQPVTEHAPPATRPVAPRTASAWSDEPFDPTPPVQAPAERPAAPPSAPAKMVGPDEIRAGFAAPAALPAVPLDENGLPRVNIPKGVIPGDKPNEDQLAAIAQLLGKLGFDDAAGRNYVLGLLGVTPADPPSLHQIPMWYEAAQILAHLTAELNQRIKNRRSA